tara:strand:+ start:162 stop:386 length:225 start_codon:yes stop_codon:yes gene_type:complete
VNNLRECIKNRDPKLTAIEVAERVGCAATDISNYISENRFPNSDRMIKLASVLKCTVVDIYPNAKRKFYFELQD